MANCSHITRYCLPKSSENFLECTRTVGAADADWHEFAVRQS